MMSVVKRQLNNRGAVLIVGLFTLALLSLLGAAATTTSRTDISINGNMRTIQESFYAAEVGLAMAEMAIDRMAGNLDLDPEETPGHYNEDTHPHWKDLTWSAYDSQEVSALDLPDNGFDHLAARPRYTVEERDFVPESLVQGIGKQSGAHIFNVYAKGTGGSQKTQTILHSIFSKKFE